MNTWKDSLLSTLWQDIDAAGVADATVAAGSAAPLQDIENICVVVAVWFVVCLLVVLSLSFGACLYLSLTGMLCREESTDIEKQ
ncbi:uncharacterized protein KNAG_0F03185 [Huiozyma naganishii CBS 8797]|uniref:Uncharacterized protein n=1 Tax=Huiozyma naganishii (strain ATCC MYA-139 / BCRC 22969 / CBS 8797 / KCTC 17520 / NBRC 10181 / NCYC 3082 / Yp74L-3) TaxID=1071383 RepID=J7S8M9_HUIN7|nr:hypothetical protein KNAG_0F03185 [Kazachstania naganishii CBS 8797]CCK70981.1 hypothetical protein KNAG_0F03185 [Kazachstania naganishii CBS 8797]